VAWEVTGVRHVPVTRRVALLFTFVYATAAARLRRAEKVLVPRC
jgi:ABC-type anion transport system duplicated permease subunit